MRRSLRQRSMATRTVAEEAASTFWELEEKVKKKEMPFYRTLKLAEKTWSYEETVEFMEKVTEAVLGTHHRRIDGYGY